MKTSSTGGSVFLRCGRVVLPDQLLKNANVVIEGGRIQSIAASGEAANVGQAVDLSDATLFPGFVDLHIHGSVGVDTMAASAEDLRKVSHFLATQGVTGWLPTLVPSPQGNYEDAIRAVDEAMTRTDQGARVLGVHYEGPFVNSSQCGALHSAYFKTFATAADIDALPTPVRPDAIRMMTLAPELEGGAELMRELVRRGWVVAIGHTRAGLEELEQAFATGVRHLTHFMNAMPALHHRAPGPVGWGLTSRDVTFDVIADGIHVDPLVLSLLLRAKGAGGMMLISDAIAAAGCGDGDYQIWGETISVRDGRTSNARGSIAGSVITMLDAVRMMASLGASEVDLATMASTNPARLLGLEQEMGSIEVGKHADLVALDKAGQVRFTMVAGQLVSDVGKSTDKR